MYKNHSGGAIGSDTYWDKIGREFGFINHNHYYYGNKTPLGNVLISNEEFEEGKNKIYLANKTLNRRPDKYMNLLARNWVQVKNSDSIFAIGSLLDEKIVDGGTGWAVQMAIDHNKFVYVFDQNKIQWFLNKYENDKFEKFYPYYEIPILTKNFAGIGTRKINENGIKAITNVYKYTLEKINL